MTRTHMLMKLIFVCLTISVAVNVLLTIQLGKIRSRPGKPKATIGEQMPALTLKSDRAVQTAFPFGKDERPSLFYWFSPTCGWCDLNLPNFKALASQTENGYRFIPVSDASPAELASYGDKHGLEFPLYSMSLSQSKQYHFSGTPTSLLISGAGVVVKEWNGAYTPSTLIDIEELLKISLPGMAASTPIASVLR